MIWKNTQIRVMLKFGRCSIDNLLYMLFMLVCSSCNSTKRADPQGKYSTDKNISLLDALKLKAQVSKDFSKQIEMNLNLKSDSTFVVLYCNKKVSISGKWKRSNDTILLHKVRFYYSQNEQENVNLLYDSIKNVIYFPNKIKLKDSVFECYTVLKKE